MKNVQYLKLWPIPLLVILLIASKIYTWPQDLKHILKQSPDAISVELHNWNGSTLSTKMGYLMPEDYNAIIGMLDSNQYSKVISRVSHHSSGGTYYFITLRCYSKRTHDKDELILAQNGLVQINGQWYESDHSNREIPNIYTFVKDNIRDQYIRNP